MDLSIYLSTLVSELVSLYFELVKFAGYIIS